MPSQQKTYTALLNRLFQLSAGITCLLLSAQACNAQPGDSLKPAGTALPVKKVQPAYHSPKKAALFSLVPGGGQIYNKKYWKLPIIYVGFGALAYSFQYNQHWYVTYRDALKNNLNNIPDAYSAYDETTLDAAYKRFRNYRDLSAIGGLALYVLNIVDAAVDAHLYTFNVSDDLSLNIHPTLISTAGYSRPYTTGLGLSIHF